jgi:chaperonin GroES
MKAKLKPLGGRVLVEPLREKETVKGGIIIPDTAKERPSQGRIVALGTGKRDDKGNNIPFEVKEGDRVLLSKYGGTEIEVDEKQYKVFEADEILAEVE